MNWVKLSFINKRLKNNDINPIRPIIVFPVPPTSTSNADVVSFQKEKILVAWVRKNRIRDHIAISFLNVFEIIF